METASSVVSLEDYRRRRPEPSPPPPSALSNFNWKLSQRGNPHITVKNTDTDERFHIVVFPQAGSWAFHIENVETGRARFSARRYATED